MDSEITDVKFYIHPEYPQDVFGIFISEVLPYEDGNLFSGYQHIGQHGAYHIDFIKESRIAKKMEYTELANELTNLVGYNLNILNEKENE